VNGKTIRIFLADGEPTGILLAEISNWTGKIIVAPRSQLDQLSKREEVRRTGVYLLVGPDPDDSLRQLVYIGEGDNVLKRLLIHNRKEAKDFWERTAVIVSKDENLTKSHVRYLESRLIKLAQDARRASLTNDTAPGPASLPEPEVADMEFFIEQVQLILPVLGFDFTQPPPTAAGDKKKGTSPLFILKRVGATAQAREIDGEFVVYAGATARKQGVAGWKSYKALRAQLVRDKKLIEGSEPDYLVLAENVAFKSPSAAASAIVGGAVNGRKNWKTEDGRTYAAWQEQKLAEVAGVDQSGDDDDA
jgi:hypothetical protein